jgi:4-hydroxyacetophenone monooxygenase
MTPELATQCDHVFLFQRTPQWIIPLAGYNSPFPPEVTWLDKNFPEYRNFLRARELASTAYSLGTVKSIDPDFDDPYSRSAAGKARRDKCVAFLERKFASRPDLLAKMIPPHPLYSSRPVVVDEEYGIADALLRENVSLVTDSIQRITPTGLETTDGSRYDVDVIVYATGFRRHDYLWPMEVRGRGGRRLEDLWAKDGGRAYLTTMVPGFPNFWMIYGPNSHGALPAGAFHEIVMRYALLCLKRLILADDESSIEVAEDPYWAFSDELDRLNETMIWADPRARRYRSKFGRFGNCPLRGTEVWQMLRRPEWNDLIVR